MQLDSDWNEWQSEYARRIQAGHAGRHRPGGLSGIDAERLQDHRRDERRGNTLYIGAGPLLRRWAARRRITVRKRQAVWDDALGEMSGAPAFATTNTAQTDYIVSRICRPTLPASGDVCVAYLDVWQRDVT